MLILDEPTSGLDPLMIEAFAETVHRLKTEGADNDLPVVARACPRSSDCATEWESFVGAD